MKFEISKRMNKAARFAAITVGMLMIGTGIAAAQGNGPNNTAPTTSTQNVNVVNTPTVSIGNSPTVNIGTMPAVSLTGTPTVNVATLPAITVGPSPLTNVGVLPSKQVMLLWVQGAPGCTSNIWRISSTGSETCFDMSSYPNQALVITDFDWITVAPQGTFCSFTLNIPSPSGGTYALARSNAVGNTTNTAYAESHYTTGVVSAVNPIVGVNGATQAVCTNSDATLRGYLIPNQ